MSRAFSGVDGVSRAYVVVVAVCCISAPTSLGFSSAALFSDGLAQVNAGYAFSRSVALAIVAPVLLKWRSKPAALLLALVLILMQTGDAVVGVMISDPLKYLGSAFLAALTGWVAWKLWSEPGESDAATFPRGSTSRVRLGWPEERLDHDQARRAPAPKTSLLQRQKSHAFIEVARPCVAFVRVGCAESLDLKQTNLLLHCVRFDRDHHCGPDTRAVDRTVHYSEVNLRDVKEVTIQEGDADDSTLVIAYRPRLLGACSLDVLGVEIRLPEPLGHRCQ